MKSKYKFYVIKLIVSLIGAFLILNLICFFYYNPTIHIQSETRSTDYIHGKNEFYSTFTEGFASGMTDKNGFNNLITFNEGEIDILVMGSSHVEAFNVAQDKNFVYLLNEKFRKSKINLNIYNIGISGHKLVRCLNNAQNAIEEFKPSQYLIIETSSLIPERNELEKALEHKLEVLQSHSDGIMEVLQKFPFLRCVYRQIKNINPESKESKTIINDENTEENTKEDIELFNELLRRVMAKCNDEGISVIIVYNCPLSLDERGKILKQNDKEDIDSFQKVCRDNGVIFVNMYDSFSDNYNKNLELPHGFSNSKLGFGHLNTYGHRCIADALYNVICEHKNDKEVQR